MRSRAPDQLRHKAKSVYAATPSGRGTAARVIASPPEDYQARDSTSPDQTSTNSSWAKMVQYVRRWRGGNLSQTHSGARLELATCPGRRPYAASLRVFFS